MLLAMPLLAAKDPDHTQRSPDPKVEIALNTEAPAAKEEPMADMFVKFLDTFVGAVGKPEFVARMAKAQKAYFDALVAEGFTREEALRIVCSSPLLSLNSK